MQFNNLFLLNLLWLSFLVEYVMCNGPGLTMNEEQDILEAHNMFRRMVDPPASDMTELVSMWYSYVVHR